MAIIISQHVRNVLEHLHGAGEPFAFLDNDEMKRINIAVRYAVYEALSWLEEEPELAAMTLATFRRDYAERPGSPELRAAYERFVVGQQDAR
jgi:hypothetical protein